MIQKNNKFSLRLPVATGAYMVVLAVMFISETHPHIGLSHNKYYLLSISSWNIHQLIGEITLLLIGGIVSEQFLQRWKVISYLIIVGAITVWFAEYTHPNTIVSGLSGATTGLIAFSVLALLWWWLERPESLLLELVSSAIAAYASIVIFTALYGVIVRAGINTVPLGIYHPGTMYDSHVAGFIIGFGYWIFEHYANSTA